MSEQQSWSLEDRVKQLEMEVAMLRSQIMPPAGDTDVQTVPNLGSHAFVAAKDRQFLFKGPSKQWAGKHENEISHAIIGCAIEVHKELGPGLLESVYEDAMCYEFGQIGLSFERQQRVPIRYKSVVLSTPLKLDLIVEGKVIVDNKAKQTVTAIDKQALLTYLRLRNVHLGLIINFHELKLVDGVQRIVNHLAE